MAVVAMKMAVESESRRWVFEITGVLLMGFQSISAMQLKRCYESCVTAISLFAPRMSLEEQIFFRHGAFTETHVHKTL
jgi:hypothetical protein